MLCPTLSELVSGRLEGQKNCFLGIGIRGVGKSQFFVGLGQWMTTIGDTNSALFYREMNATYIRQNTNIRMIVFNIVKNAKWDKCPVEPWENIGKCWEWLNQNDKRIFIVLDEFESVYVEDMSSVGSMSGKRPLVIVALGSSSDLRSLCFCKGNLDNMMSRGYLGYKYRTNLNSTKFVPVLFGPITTINMTK